MLRTKDLEVAASKRERRERERREREERGERERRGVLCGRYWIAIAQWDDNLNEFRNNIK